MSGKTKEVLQQSTMLTRHKSSLMRRKLRDKNRSLSHVTDLLRNPQTTKKATNKLSPKKCNINKNNQMKSPIKKDGLKKQEETVSSQVPLRQKRNIKVRKILLKSRNEMMKIGGLNKRKRYDPMRDAGSEPPVKTAKASSQTCLTMCELISMVDSKEELTDEDLMEILTCPSPVWWEDYPGLEFLDEPIVRDKETIADNIQIQEDNEQGCIDFSKTKIDCKDAIFSKKRSVLENLLSNIKKGVESQKRETKNDDTEPNNVKCDIKEADNDRKIVKSRRKSSVQAFEIEEDALQSLKNIHIPIDNERNKVEDTVDVDSLNDCIIVDDKKDMDTLTTAVKKDTIDKITKLENDVEEESLNDCVIVEEDNKDINTLKTPTNKDRLEKSTVTVKKHNSKKILEAFKEITDNAKKNKVGSSPKALIFTSSTGEKKVINLINDCDDDATEKGDDKSSSSSTIAKEVVGTETSPESIEHADTISDTNINFLIDDQISSNSDSTEKSEEKREETDKKVNKIDLRQAYLQLTRQITSDRKDESVEEN